VKVVNTVDVVAVRLTDVLVTGTIKVLVDSLVTVCKVVDTAVDVSTDAWLDRYPGA